MTAFLTPGTVRSISASTSLGTVEGRDVLDLGCGDGTTALPAARAGATMNAFDAAARDGREAQLQAELAELFEAQNRAGAERTEIVATYMKVR